jgi:purine-binding chemotaxis protein CheW
MKQADNKKQEKIFTYLSFLLNDEYFAVDVIKVLTILEIKPITRVPNSPEYMRGVINLRGNVLPVIDMRIKFGMTPTAFTKNTCIVVLSVYIEEEPVQLGILVDAIDRVTEIKEKNIEPAPTIGTKYKNEFIQGLYKLKDGFILLLDINLIFNSDTEIIAKDSESKFAVS